MSEVSSLSVLLFFAYSLNSFSGLLVFKGKTDSFAKRESKFDKSCIFKLVSSVTIDLFSFILCDILRFIVHCTLVPPQTGLDTKTWQLTSYSSQVTLKIKIDSLLSYDMECFVLLRDMPVPTIKDLLCFEILFCNQYASRFYKNFAVFLGILNIFILMVKSYLNAHCPNMNFQMQTNH